MSGVTALLTCSARRTAVHAAVPPMQLERTHRQPRVTSAHVVRLLDEVLDAKPPRHHAERRPARRLMPEGLGLNVNVPLFTAGAGPTLRFALTHVGVATAYAPAFYARLSDSPLAVASSVNLPLPGVSLAQGGAVLPSGAVIPKDDDRNAEGNVVARGAAVTLSPVQGVPEASRRYEAWLKSRLGR